MFQGLSNSQRQFFSSSNENINYESDSEDDHYEEVDDVYTIFDDGITFDENIDDEYEEFDEEMESDIPEPLDSDSLININFIDEEEVEHYDSLEDE